MARWVNQRWEERLQDGTNPRVETKWNVVGDVPANPDYSILQARLDLLAEIPSSVSNLPLTEITIDRLGGSGLFTADAVYSMRQIPEDGKWDFTMDSRPEAFRSFMALSTVATYQPNGYSAAIDNNGLALPNSDHASQGADIYRPVKTFNVSVWWSLTRFVGTQTANYQTLQAYINLLDTLEGCVNSSTFTFTARGLTFTFLAGECLLAGTRLSQQGADLWQIDLELKRKKNYVEPSLTTWNGSDVTLQGWDRVEFQEAPYADNTAIGIGTKPRGAKIYRDYFRADLNLLKVPAP